MGTKRILKGFKCSVQSLNNGREDYYTDTHLYTKRRAVTTRFVIGGYLFRIIPQYLICVFLSAFSPRMKPQRLCRTFTPWLSYLNVLVSTDSALVFNSPPCFFSLALIIIERTIYKPYFQLLNLTRM